MFPIAPVQMPADLVGKTNGKLPADLLSNVGPRGDLHHLAARAWLALVDAAGKQGLPLTYTYGGTFRSYAEQEALFRSRYTPGGTGGGCKNWNGVQWCKKSAKYATAATPGSSNHGWGLAVDSAFDTDPSDGLGPDDAAAIVAHPQWPWLLANAARFGWSWELQSEPWHLRYVAGDNVPQAVLDFEGPTMNPFVLAGVDTNGTDYNGRCGMIMPGGGSGLILESDLSLRSCQLRGGTVTKGIANPMTYSRPYTKQSHTTFPWTFSGQIKINARAPDGSVWIYGEERAPTWQHGVCFSVWADEDNNAMSCAKPSTNVWGATGQIDGVYGIEYESLYRNRVKYAEVCTGGVWHRFELTAVAPGHHRLFWDGVLMVEAIEKNPAPFWSRELHGECRLDFYDYALMIDAPPVWEIDMREVIYTPPAGSPKGTPWLYQEGGSITYCTSWMHAHATADKVPVEALNAEQYPLARKAAGL